MTIPNALFFAQKIRNILIVIKYAKQIVELAMINIIYQLKKMAKLLMNVLIFVHKLQITGMQVIIIVSMIALKLAIHV